MANKYDLKTWVRQSLVVATAAGNVEGASVGSGTAATGKTRFLTYIRATRRTAVSALASLTVGLGEAATTAPAGSTVFASANLKLALNFPTAAASCVTPMTVQEIHGSIEHPIISVAGGTYMGIALEGTSSSSVALFAEYYDE